MCEFGVVKIMCLIKDAKKVIIVEMALITVSDLRNLGNKGFFQELCKQEVGN